MRLRRLELDQFKKFERAICVEEIADGLNLVAGPNELGKSTLLEALRAVLFERHRSGAQPVRDLQHHRHKTAPWVALTFEIDGRAYRIEKRFLQRPFARLTLPDGRRLEGDPAEDMLQELLGRGRPLRPGGEVGSLWQLLLVGQGRSLEQASVGGSARQTLEASLQAELGSLTGAESGHALCRAIEDQLYRLIDRRNGRAKGRFRELEAELAAALRERAELDRRKADLEQDLERLERARALHRELRAEEEAGLEPKELVDALARRDELMQLRAETREAASALELARRDLRAAEAEIANRERAQAELARAEHARAEAEIVCADAQARASETEARLQVAQAGLARLETERVEAERRLRILDELARAVREHDQVRVALDDAAAEVSLEIAPDALERVRLAGQRLHGSPQVARITDPLEIEIGGIGRITVRPAPGRRERLSRRRDDAAARAAGLLQELGTGSPRTGSSLPDPAGMRQMSAEAESRLERAGSEGRRAREEVDAALAAWHRARAAAEQAAARLADLQAREAELRRTLALAEAGARETGLAAALHESRERMGVAAAALERLHARAGGETLEAVEHRVGELQTLIDERGRRRQALELEVERLAARIELQQGAGLEEQIEALRGRTAQLERQHAACLRETRILGLLRDVLQDAEQDAKDYYLAPVIARIRPSLQVLFPGAEIAIDERFQVTTITRELAGPERFEQLSHGTREQIAVLTRLAFAELLADQGMPAVVVLDDALVFSDDDRLARMFEVLERAADKLQILVFTCRERAFSGLRATRPRLMQGDPVRDASAPAVPA